MRCKRWGRKLQDFQAGRLGAQAREAFQAHLSACPDCQQHLAWEQALETTLHAEPAVKAPANFNQAVWRKIKVQAPESVPAPGRPVFSFLRPALAALAVSAAAALLVLVSFRSLHFLNPPVPKVMASRSAGKASPSETPGTLGRKNSQGQIQTAAREKKAENPLPLPAPASAVQSQNPQAATEKIAAIPPNPPANHAAQVPAGVHGPTAPGAAAALGPQHPATGVSAAIAAPAVNITPAATLGVASEPRLFNNKIHVNWNERTRLEFDLPHSGLVSVRIYSREGRLVKTVLHAELPAGPQFLDWNGTTDSGQKVASGVYFMVFSSPSGEKKFKLAVIK